MRLQGSIIKNKNLQRRNAAGKLKKQLIKIKAGSPAVQSLLETHPNDNLYKTTFESAQVGIAHVGLDGKWIRANNRFCEIAGWSVEELFNKTFLDITHPDDQVRDLELVEKLMKEPEAKATMEKRYVRKDGSLRWVRASGTIVRDQDGAPRYGIAVIVDIHEEKLLVKNLELLARAGKVLGGSLDYSETLAAVADLVVPQLADWCIIDVLGEDKVFHRVKIAYHDPADKDLAEKFYDFVPRNQKKSLIEQAIHLKKTILIPEVKKDKLPGYALNKKHLRAIMRLKLSTLMVVPLQARGKVFGAMSFLSSKPYRKYSIVDLALAEQIADRVSLAVDNAHLYNNARKAIQIRDNFLSITSHELKTSLTAIKALGQLMQRELVKEKTRGSYIEFLKKIDSQLNRSTKLINDLLDVSKIQSGKILIKKEWIDIDYVVHEAVDMCRQLSSFHEIKIVGESGKLVFADRDRINQVITNLISNAIKYAPDAKDIVVKLGNNMGNVVVSVKDFGIGIEEDKKKRIFERFFRALGTSREKAGGLGLGLFISSELIKQHGGFIKVDSKVGKGSTFKVTIPISSEMDLSIH